MMSEFTAHAACSRKPITVVGIREFSSSSSISWKFWPSAEATTTPSRMPSSRRRRMWSSMSGSTSESSPIFGLANTAKPTLRSASTHGRTMSAEPGAMLVNTVASGSMCVPTSSARSIVRSTSQRPTASKRGRCAAVGREPRIAPRPMSMFGASQTSSRVGVVSGDSE